MANRTFTLRASFGPQLIAAFEIVVPRQAVRHLAKRFLVCFDPHFETPMIAEGRKDQENLRIRGTGHHCNAP